MVMNKKRGALTKVEFSDDEIPIRKERTETIQMNQRINLILSILKKKPHTLMELVIFTGYCERTVCYYLDIIRKRRLVKLEECDKCGCLNRFYTYQK